MSPFGAARMLDCFKHKDPGRGVIAQIALYAPPSATSLTMSGVERCSWSWQSVLLTVESRVLSAQCSCAGSVRCTWTIVSSFSR
jgi:hypothetical protein